jgi:cell division protein ZapA (FtsZ GTPase activity inhibitor)
LLAEALLDTIKDVAKAAAGALARRCSLPSASVLAAAWQHVSKQILEARSATLLLRARRGDVAALLIAHCLAELAQDIREAAAAGLSATLTSGCRTSLLAHGLAELAQNIGKTAAAGRLALGCLLRLSATADELLEKAACVEHGSLLSVANELVRPEHNVVSAGRESNDGL